ncbi:MAG: inositol monophosphatase [Bacteroidetes bacterium]|nr:inositol monophosphatase [Bacteroidota bacterium]
MDYQDLMNRVIPAVKEVGAFILAEQKTFRPEQVEFKGKNDLVSYVDRNSELMLVERLNQLTPHCGYINEEGGSTDVGSELVWIIDPVDGTTNFVHHIPMFCTSVALMAEGKLQLGLIYEPNRDELFTAVRGQGAFLNGEVIRVSSNARSEDAFLSTGFPYRKNQNVDDYLQILREYLGRIRGIRRMGSAALDLAYTASGRFDGFFEASLSPWDVAAGALIVQEAGGCVTDYWGEDNWLFGRSILASNQHLHPELLQIMVGYLQRLGLEPGSSLE